MVFICYSKCGTCRKAEKWLNENGFSFEKRDIKENAPTLSELKKWYKQSGLPLKKFFNISGNVYKELKLKDNLPQMNEDMQLELLASNGMLVKRPILLKGDDVLVGFNEQQWSDKLK